MNELPSGWEESTLGEIAEIVGGGTPSSSNPDYFSNDAAIAWITPADLSGFRAMYISRGKRFLTEAGLKNSSARLMPQGTVLFSSRAPIGYVAIAANDICTNQGFKSLVPRTGIVSEYLYFYMRFAKPLAEILASGTTFPEISGRNAARIRFILPPLNEQKRIVEKLEKLLGRVEAVQARLDKIPVILKRFRQSVLAAACSGQLTADWRNERGVTDEWEVTTLSQQFAMRNGKSMTSRMMRPGDIPVYGGNGQSGMHDNFNAEGQVIVIGRVGAQCGNVHFVSGKVWVSDNAIALSTKEKIDPQFYTFFLQSQNLNQLSGGTGQPYVSQEILSPIESPIVEIGEQKEIVRRVEELFKFADTVEERYKKAKAHTDKLTQSILAKAFRGELVPQDPNDEPASVLLERIKESRA